MKWLINKYHTYVELWYPTLKEVAIHYEWCLGNNSLRHDMLAFILNLAEINYQSWVLILENYRGVLLAGAL